MSNDRRFYNRAKTLTEYIQREFAIFERMIQVTNTPEDWQGLKEVVEASQINEKTYMHLKNMGTVCQALLQDFFATMNGM